MQVGLFLNETIYLNLPSNPLLLTGAEHAVAAFEGAVLESLTYLFSSFFLSDFIDVTRPVCLVLVTWAEKLVWGTVLAVNEASLPCLLCLQINKGKIGDFF